MPHLLKVGRPRARLNQTIKEIPMSPIKKVAGALAVGVMSIGVAAGPADAQTRQDGLVNVAVGDVTILEDVNIAAAVDAAVQACDAVDVGNVTLLAQRTDNTS